MPNIKKEISSLLLVRHHFVYAAVLLLGLILFDVWKVIPPDQLRVRWLLIIVLFAVTAILYQLASIFTRDIQHRTIIYSLILIDIIIAASFVYLERGIASTSVALFAVPIAASTSLKNARSTYTIALLSVAAYALSCVSYFLDNQFEEFRARFYGTLIFHGVMMMVIALMLVSGNKKN